MLQEEGIAFAREFIIDSKSRIDFLVGAVGLEVKVGGSLAAVTRQLFRYAQVEVIKELVLVSSRQFHNQLPAEMNGKPLRAISLTMSAF